MTVANKQSVESQVSGQVAQRTQKAGKAKKVNTRKERKRTGAAKRESQARLGRRAPLQPIDLATPQAAADALWDNSRTVSAGGRKKRVDAEENLAAFPLILDVCNHNERGLAERGTTRVVVKAGQLIADRLSVLLQVEGFSPAAVPEDEWLDAAAFVGRRRDAIIRVLPGAPNAKARAAFGFGEQVRADDPVTVQRGAQALLAGKQAKPKSRAAKLITAADEKRLRAIVEEVTAFLTARARTRASGTDRTTERELLNVALELFYDDYAASIGLALEGDEVARAQALKLIPRREDRRDEAEGQGGGAGAGAQGASGAQGEAGSQAGGSAGTAGSAMSGAAAPVAS